MENSRINKNRNIVFSNRFSPSIDGKLWDENYNHSKFDEKTNSIINSSDYEYIILADIADFFPRIYTHILENSLIRATGKRAHIESIKRLLKTIYQNVSYGIPVGSEISFLLSETMLDSIDRRLIDENILYCRYVDDFRIFCKTEKEAYHHLNFLVELLFNNLVLTLQQHKTKILTTEQYKRIKEIKPQLFQPLSEKFLQFLENELELSGPYQTINFEDLSSEIKEKLYKFEFDKIIEEQLVLERSNINLIKVVLNTLAHRANPIAIQNILNNIEKFYPVMNTVMLYFSKLANLNLTIKKDIGEQFIDILKNSFMGHSKYIRMWILYLFSQSKDWGGFDEFVNLYNAFSDDFSRRKLILAMGRSKKDYWFTAERRKFPTEFTSWQKRAFLRAYSCVQENEKKHWYNSIKKGGALDILDKAIIEWVKTNSF